MTLKESNLDGLYTQRLLVFLEIDPQSNKYNQVLFTPEEFKELTAKIGKLVEKNGDKEVVQLELSEEEYVLPDLEDVYDQ